MSEKTNDRKIYKYFITTDYDLVVINDKEFPTSKEVCELIERISKERDTYLNQIKNAQLKN